MVFGYVYETGKRVRNEDALLFRSSLFAGGELTYAAVCDGMGGTGNGMEASYFCIREIEAWYDRQLIPLIGTCGLQSKDIKAAVKSKGFNLYRQINRELFEQMRHTGKSLGTTAIMCAIYKGRYYLFHIGDSRAYLLWDYGGIFRCRRLTRDHGNEKGLSKCLGLNREWKPDFKTGRIGKGGMLLCTDGFWRRAERKIWKSCINPAKMKEESVIGKRLKEIADYNMRRGEKDNISAIYVCDHKNTGRILCRTEMEQKKRKG